MADTTIDTLTIKEARDAVERGREIEKVLGSPNCSSVTTGKKVANGAAEEHGLQIVVLDRGFVFVGDVSSDGDWLVIANAKNVRRWGTSQGLGELAAKGPQPETKLDIGGTIKAPMRAVIGLIKCEVASWKK